MDVSTVSVKLRKTAEAALQEDAEDDGFLPALIIQAADHAFGIRILLLEKKRGEIPVDIRAVRKLMKRRGVGSRQLPQLDASALKMRDFREQLVCYAS